MVFVVVFLLILVCAVLLVRRDLFTPLPPDAVTAMRTVTEESVQTGKRISTPADTQKGTAQSGPEDQLIKALQDTALIFFRVNLSKNRVTGSIIQKFDDGTSINVLEKLGLSDNCSFTSFIEAWRAFVDTQFLGAYDNFFNPETLTGGFRSGIRESSLIYKTFNARGEDLWAKQTLLLTEDVDTGDILAFVYAHDVTAEMERNTQT